jgi:IS4 transposase
MSGYRIRQLCARRWGVELFYRTLKQTFGRGKLRSHRADHAMWN